MGNVLDGDRLALTQALTGINLLPITDKQKNQNAYLAGVEAEKAIARLKEKGVDVPTYTELVRLGLAPDLTVKDPLAPKAPKRTSQQVDEDIIAKINAARAANGEPPLDVQAAPRASSGKKSKFFG